MAISRLVGEGPKQLDVARGKRTRLNPRDTKDADWRPGTHQGREHHAPITAQSRHFFVHGWHVLPIRYRGIHVSPIANQVKSCKLGKRSGK